MNEIKEIENSYTISLKRKEWKQLSDMEKKLFEWFKEELNGDQTCSAMFAVDIYEQLILPYINSHYIAKDKVKGLKSARAEVGYYDMNESRVQGYNNAVEHFNSKIDDLVEDK